MQAAPHCAASRPSNAPRRSNPVHPERPYPPCRFAQPAAAIGFVAEKPAEPFFGQPQADWLAGFLGVGEQADGESVFCDRRAHGLSVPRNGSRPATQADDGPTVSCVLLALIFKASRPPPACCPQLPPSSLPCPRRPRRWHRLRRRDSHCAIVAGPYFPPRHEHQKGNHDGRG
jgi:hypothetical protein